MLLCMYYGKAPFPPIEKWSLAFKTTLVWFDKNFSKEHPFEKNENNFVAEKINFPAGVVLQYSCQDKQGWAFRAWKFRIFLKPKFWPFFEEPVHLLCVFRIFYKENFILEVFCLLSWAISLKSVSLTSVRPTSYAKRDCEYTKQLCEHCHHKQKYHLNCSLQPQHDHFPKKM